MMSGQSPGRVISTSRHSKLATASRTSGALTAEASCIFSAHAANLAFPQRLNCQQASNKWQGFTWNRLARKGKKQAKGKEKKQVGAGKKREA